MRISFGGVLTAVAAIAIAPAYAFDLATGGTGNGSLIVTVYDPIRAVSVVQDLSINYLDFLNSSIARDGTPGTDVTPYPGFTLNFQVDMSTFSESDIGDLRWSVFGADAQGPLSATEVLVSANASLGSIPGTNTDVIVMLGTSGYARVVGQCHFAGMPSVCTGSMFEGVYLGGSEWGENFLTMDVSAAGRVGDSLGFYGLGRSSPAAGAPLFSYQYGTDAGVATWTLASNGTLTWLATPPAVPLPAAIWLLISGLGGLAALNRARRK